MAVRKRSMLTGVVLALFAPLAVAHTGQVTTANFLSGLGHPLTGPDHLLVMLVAGILIARHAGRQAGLWLPGFAAVFVLAMLAGRQADGMAGLELLLALSVVLAGLALQRITATGYALLALLGVGVAGLHGYAHGLEMPLAARAAWMAGVATAMLAVTGGAVLLGRLALARLRPDPRFRYLGYGVMVSGLVIAMT